MTSLLHCELCVVSGLCPDPAVFPRVFRESFSTVRSDCFHRIKEDICRQINEFVGSATQAHPVCLATITHYYLMIIDFVRHAQT